MIGWKPSNRSLPCGVGMPETLLFLTFRREKQV